MNLRFTSLLLASACFGTANATAQGFEPPFRLEAEGKPIDVEIGHAAPYLYDFDGDGVRDLLVGQFGQGRCRIYKNEGTATAPKFSKFEWFQAGGDVASVKAG